MSSPSQTQLQTPHAESTPALLTIFDLFTLFIQLSGPAGVRPVSGGGLHALWGSGLEPEDEMRHRCEAGTDALFGRIGRRGRWGTDVGRMDG